MFVCHAPADIIAELTPLKDATQPVHHMMSIMGELLVALCMERCQLLSDSSDASQERRGFYTMEFVTENRFPGSQNMTQTWDDHFDSSTNGRLWKWHQYSGVPVFQQLSLDSDAILNETQNKNLYWNARVIVMDLFLSLENKKVKDSEKDKSLSGVVQSLLILSSHFKLDDPPSKWSLGVQLFWFYFWLPAFNNFKSVFNNPSSDSRVRIAAVGELCHVLGITCRTQWMKTGFSSKASRDSEPTVYECRCRYERLLELLGKDVGFFVANMKEVYGMLKKVYLSKVELSAGSAPASVSSLIKKAGSDCFVVVDAVNKMAITMDKNQQENDPRRKANVHLLALLDLS
jgi:hypothetical protein